MINNNTEEKSPNTVEEILDRNEYRVVVKKTDTGCVTHFPGRVEYPVVAFSRLYHEYKPEGVFVCAYDEDGQELCEWTISCPMYVQRAYIIYTIISQCIRMEYDTSMIKFMSGKETLSYEDFNSINLSPFMDMSDIMKEEKLDAIVTDGCRNGFSDKHDEIADSEGLLEGFMLIRELFTLGTDDEELQGVNQ